MNQPEVQFEPLTTGAQPSPAQRGKHDNDTIIYGIDPRTLTVEVKVCHSLEVMCGDDPAEVGAWLLTRWDDISVHDLSIVGTQEEREILRGLRLKAIEVRQAPV
ncbi:hypothetical protein [Devosia sp.]|uniref:hypothetical protein n=1 Tax=Devosia sp. TaxID=1871048 RepID=UPI0032657C53